jgi:hypothetical protein
MEHLLWLITTAGNQRSSLAAYTALLPVSTEGRYHFAAKIFVRLIINYVREKRQIISDETFPIGCNDTIFIPWIHLLKRLPTSPVGINHEFGASHTYFQNQHGRRPGKLVALTHREMIDGLQQFYYLCSSWTGVMLSTSTITWSYLYFQEQPSEIIHPIDLA